MNQSAILAELENKSTGGEDDEFQRLRAMTGTGTRQRGNSFVQSARSRTGSIARSRTGSITSKASYDSAEPPKFSRSESGEQNPAAPAPYYNRSDIHSFSSLPGGPGSPSARNRAMSAVDRVKEAVSPTVNFSSMWLCSSPFFIVVIYLKGMKRRLTGYLAVLFCLSLVIFSSGRDGQNNVVMGVSASGWYSFTTLFFFFDFITATIDHVLFYAIDTYWCGDFQMAYSLHAFKGPVGLFLLLIVVSNAMWDMSVPQAIPTFSLLISTAVVILLLYSIKNYIQHVYYIGLLEKRFIGRLVKLDQYRHILSTLASNKISPPQKPRSYSCSSAVSIGSESPLPDKSTSASVSVTDQSAQARYPPPSKLAPTSARPLAVVEEEDERRNSSPNSGLAIGIPPSNNSQSKSFKPFENNGRPPLSPSPSPLVKMSDTDNSIHNPMINSAVEDRVAPEAAIPITSWRNSIPFLGLQDLNTQKVKDVFLEIVADDSREDDEDEFRDDGKSTSKLFWTRMGQLSDGALRVMSYNGMLSVNKRAQAKIFGHRLFIHLSRHGRVTITTGMLRDALRTLGTEGIPSLLTPDITSNRSSAVAGIDIKAVVDATTMLFSLASDDDVEVTEKGIVAGVLEAYKEMKYATSSLYDFSGLQQSLRAVIDFFFWILMAVVAQCILQFDLSTVLAPGISLILVLSFALGPFFGNMFLSVAFVFFMLPFDIGDRVFFTSMTTHCYIIGIGLLHTTVRTIYNEKIYIPNHTLFSEKISNFCRSEGMTYEIVVHFPFDGPARCSEEKIAMFNARIKHYCLVEKKDEWKFCWPVFSGVDVSSNRVNYSLWVTHHCNLSQIERVINARTEFYKHIRSTCFELNISYTAAVIPVYTIAERKSSLVNSEVGIDNLQPPFNLNMEVPPAPRAKVD